MVSGSKLILLSQAVSAAGTIVGPSQGLPTGSKGLILVCKVSNHSAGSFTLTVEQSPDGQTWETLDTVATVSGDGFAKTIVSDSATFHLFRASLVSASSPDAEVECSIYHSK